MLPDSRMKKDSCPVDDEIENVPLNNPNHIHSHPPDSSSSRAPFHSIPDDATKPLFINNKNPVKSSRKVRFGYDSTYSPHSASTSTSTRNHSFNLTPRLTTKTASTTYSDTTTSTLNTRTKSVTKPPNPAFLYSNSRHATATSRPSSLSRPSLVNTLDVPHFDLKEDPSFWMDHNVQVIIRVRPLNANERNLYGYNRCVKQESAHCIAWIGHPETRFTFDHVACETVDQEMLFRMAALPMVENCFSGYNSCMFAYGQTGSGKTYTMLGEMEDDEFTPSPHRGMTPRIFEFLFARIRAEEESRRDEKLKYSCKCSFLEIYNEQIRDLLDPSSTNLLLREDVKKCVYVENLSEFEVHTVGDVLGLLIQGSSNRKVAATNMNRESSRSHCVFIFIIESKWERDSVTNYRFARLNLVDLACSERQKSSGAEGERLKEAANINKSLWTLGNVIRLLVDIAHGKPRHIPYRDSRLTFLLQGSLGGNSKTMIIANVSPSVCCAAETLNTLKFAQRAKLIQNNAVVNEDSSGDIAVLQHQIWLLQEELSALKHQNVSRTLAFDPSQVHSEQGSRSVKDQVNAEDSFESESKGGVRVSPKKLKTLEMMLAGALRREQMSEASMKQLESEIEQLNRLVRQREEDTRCTKMMLKFREDKILRMESLLGKVKPVDAYLLEENAALSEEIQMLQAKVDRNPEVTRFAVENNRLLEELRRFQDFYEEGERDLLMNEVSELRAQLIRFHDDSMQQHMVSNTAQDAANDRKENESLTSKLTSTANELAECQTKLKACLETNSKLSREIEVLHDQLRNKDLELSGCHAILDAMKDIQVPLIPSQASERVVDENITAEEVVNLELEVDILKIILKEEKLSRCEMEELASSLTKDVQKAEQQVFCISKQCRDVEADLLEAKSVIQALESQQLLSIIEIEDLKKRNGHHLELLCNQELQISALKEQASRHESSSCLKLSECEDLPLQEHLKRMQASLDKAKRLNIWYQSDHAYQRSNEEEMDQIRRQAEAETAEVIVCLQEELSVLQERVNESDSREKEAENRSLILETKLKELHEDFNRLSSDNQVLCHNLLEKELQIKLLTDDWEQLSCEIEEALIEGHEALRSASNELSNASTSYPRGLVSAQVGKMIRQISDKESLIQELNTFLEKANTKTVDMEHMLMSLKGATIVMSEAHQQEFCEKENEILKLRSELQASLSAKKEGIYLSEMNDLETIQAVEVGVLSLQAAFVDFEKQCQSKFQTLSPKLNKLEENAKEAKCSWHHLKELLEYELVDSKAAEAQKAEEASCLLVQFEEVQETMKEADMMINGLMIANETMKLEIEDCKNMNIMLNGEVERLVNEVQTLQSANELKDQKCSYLEKEVALNALETVGLLEELQGLVSSVKDASEKAVISLTQDFSCFKSHLQETLNLMHSSLEDIWSEIVSRDCTVSVLHLCHIDMLSEVATLINSEKSLQHDIFESETLINSLREQNMKSKQELEICRLVKDRLLSDIELSFNRLSSNEGETRELHMKLDRFKENLAALQCQEELMLETCNLMGSKLTMLEKESNQSNSTVAAALVEHDMLQEYNTKLIEQNCCTTLDSAVTEIVTSRIFADLREHLLLEKESAKDLEVSFVKSELQQLSQHNFYMDKQQQICCTALNSLVAEIVTQKMFADLREQLLFEKESEVDHLQATLGMAQDNLAVLQRREELLSSKLAMLEEELNLSKSTVGASLVEQDKLQKTNTKLIESQAEVFSMELYAKDLEVSFVTSELQQLAQHNSYMDRQQQIFCTALDSLVSEIVTQKMFADLREQLLSEKESEVDNMHTTIKKAQDSESRVLIELQALGTLSSNKVAECADSVEMAELESCRIFSKLQQNIMLVMDQISVDSCQNIQSVSKFLEELELIDNMANDILSQNLFLKQMLLRKDEVLNGLLFDLRLLQESAANIKDQQNQIEEMVVALDSTECALDTKSRELDEAIAFGIVLEAKVKEQRDVILATKMDLENANQSLKILFDENEELKSQVKDISAARISVEKELCEKRSAIDSLENELLEMGNTLGQMNDLVESLKNTLDDVNGEKDRLQKELMILEAKLETTHALARENEAIAVEAQQIAESRRLYAEEKEEEVQLLERSVQELDSTITVLENKVDALKGETERQRFQREELELELHTFKNQMQSVEFADSEVKRQLDEKTRNLQEALTLIDVLKKGLAHRDTEVAKCKTHISELSLHAEAQASEYKQKFNELEATLEHFRAEAASNHEQNASCNKLEKNPPKARGSASPFKAKGSSSPFKGRGSGSPFKCIGLGLAHQLKSEKDEETNAEKLRIEELESLAATRQKEIFVLNARLAATESMTHDVIRDLLGVKLDISSCANLLDKQQVKIITERAQLDSGESQDHEVIRLKKQLNEFIEERKGWLEEIDRRQTELVAAQITLEKLREQELFLSTENNVLKRDLTNHKRQVVELEGEMKKLSGQQNLHQRIHHHAKIKEENNMLKIQNEALSAKVLQAEAYLKRVRKGLSNYHQASNRRLIDRVMIEE